MCYKGRVIGNGIFNLRGSGVVSAHSFMQWKYVLLSFCSNVLGLDQMTFIYELDPYRLEIHWICKYELPKSRLLQIIILQTESTKIISHVISWVAKNRGPRRDVPETMFHEAG